MKYDHSGIPYWEMANIIITRYLMLKRCYRKYAKHPRTQMKIYYKMRNKTKSPEWESQGIGKMPNVLFNTFSAIHPIRARILCDGIMQDHTTTPE